jgi:hypothetical protein
MGVGLLALAGLTFLFYRIDKKRRKKVSEDGREIRKESCGEDSREENRKDNDDE